MNKFTINVVAKYKLACNSVTRNARELMLSLGCDIPAKEVTP